MTNVSAGLPKGAPDGGRAGWVGSTERNIVEEPGCGPAYLYRAFLIDELFAGRAVAEGLGASVMPKVAT